MSEEMVAVSAPREEEMVVEFRKEAERVVHALRAYWTHGAGSKPLFWKPLFCPCLRCVPDDRPEPYRTVAHIGTPLEIEAAEGER